MAKFDESRILVDETGYNYVKVTPQEILKWGGYCICNGCNNQFLRENMNLCFAAGDTYCDKCFNDMRKRWKRDLSKEDIEYDLKLQDSQALDWYKYHLDDEFRAKIIRQNEEASHYNEHIINLVNDDEFEKILKELAENEN